MFGTCDNRRAYAVQSIERRVVENLQQHLRDPRAIERFLATYRAERKRLAAAESGRRAQAEKRLGEIRRDLDRSLNSLIKGIVPAEKIGPHITRLSEEEKRLESELAAKPDDTIVSLHPTAVRRYLAAVDELAAMLATRALDTAQESPKALRDLIDCVIVHPAEGEPALEIKGRLPALTGSDLFPQTKFGNVSLDTPSHMI